MAQLRVKDILLQPEDFDPRMLYMPNNISRNNEMWAAKMSIEEFKTFWHQERTAFQFEYRPEGGCNTDLLKGDSDALLPIFNPNRPYGGTPGGQKRFDWSFRFSCRRYRQGKDLTIKRQPIGQKCPVSIWMKKPVGKETVLIEYKWRHNHADSGEASL